MDVGTSRERLSYSILDDNEGASEPKMNCCAAGDINDLNRTFDARAAQKDARSYRRGTLDHRARRLIAHIAGEASGGLTVLDIGCGAGSVHQELLRRGLAVRATGVDAAAAYVDAAAGNARHFGLGDRTSYAHADFALAADRFAPADLVILDRAICCYPDLPGLLGPAARHADKLLALTMPPDRWWAKAAYAVLAGFLRLRGSGYMPYLHSEQDVRAVAATAGLEQANSGRSGFWRILVYRRVGPPAVDS